MKLIRNLFKKDEELSIEDKNKINSIVENKNKPSQDQVRERIDLNELVTQLNLEQINQLKDLLEKREDELHELYGLKSETLKRKTPYSGEIEVKEPVHEEDLDNKTYKEEQKNYKEQIDEISNSITEEVENEDIPEYQIKTQNHQIQDDKEGYIQIEDDIEIQEIEDENDNYIHNTQEDIYLKLVKIFGQENIFKEIKTNLHENLPKDREILCIGIRKFNSFNREDDSTQNSWFIKNIKQLEELSHFKMLSSAPTRKELFWDREKLPVFISFKSTTELKSLDEFEF